MIETDLNFPSLPEKEREAAEFIAMFRRNRRDREALINLGLEFAAQGRRQVEQLVRDAAAKAEKLIGIVAEVEREIGCCAVPQSEADVDG